MCKWQILIITFFALSTKVLAQDSVAEMKESRKQILMYKHLYYSADSLNKNSMNGLLGDNIYKTADSLDKLPPQEYFLKATELMHINNLNEASFIFYLGRLRYRYYNSVNPNYKESDDGALLASLSYEVGEPINMFLTANFDNYVSVLKKSVDWYVNHDYKFFPGDKNKEKYLMQSNGLTAMIADVEKNRTKYEKDWIEQRQKSEKRFDEGLKEVDEALKKNKQ